MLRKTLFDGSDWPLFSDIPWPFSAFCGFQAHLSHGRTPIMEDQTVEVAGKVGEREFGLRTGNCDGADEQAIAVLLVGEVRKC